MLLNLQNVFKKKSLFSPLSDEIQMHTLMRIDFFPPQ